MIDENKLIEHINGMEDTCNLFRWRSPKKIKEGLASVILREPKIGGWIPCSERLPEKGVMNPITNDYAEYLCTVCVDGFRTVRPIKFDKDGCWVNHGMNFDKYVTAWQPLPEEYHG